MCTFSIFGIQTKMIIKNWHK